MKRDYFNADPKHELARYMEDCFLNEIARTGTIADLDVTSSDVITEAAKRYPHLPNQLRENSYICDLINEVIMKMDWRDGDE